MIDFLVDLETGSGGNDRCWGILIQFENKRRVETRFPLADSLAHQAGV